MSTTDVEARGPGEVEPTESPAEHVAVSPAVRDRVLLPLLLPIGAILFVAFYTINLSRVFLAGTGTPAVVTATLVTTLILVGAAAMSASPRARSSNLTLVVAGSLAVILTAGLVTLGASQEKKEAGGGGFQEPTGKPVGTVSLHAGNLYFKPDALDSPAGVVEFDVTLDGGSHTFQFHDAALAGFKLDLNKAGATFKGKVELQAGKTYNFYCGIAGHEAGGMKGTIAVGASAGATTASTATGGAGGAGGAQPTATTGAV